MSTQYAVFDTALDYVVHAPCSNPGDPALAIYDERGDAVLAAERLGFEGWHVEVREVLIEKRAAPLPMPPPWIWT